MQRRDATEETEPAYTHPHRMISRAPETYTHTHVAVEGRNGSAWRWLPPLLQLP